MIPPEIVRQITETARIEEVLGGFVSLKKAGQSFKALSPFTNEKTPSFFVSPSKQIFKDFSSGKGGNVVTFLMEHEQMTYPEALRWLAKKYNIEIPERPLSPEEHEEANEREGLYLVNAFAESFFEDSLKGGEGKAVGYSYLVERGFSDEIIEKFKLGYNDKDGNPLLSKAIEKGYKREFLEILGLIKERQGGWTDTYRGRVVFPIHNLSGRCIGFGARTLLKHKNVPKYLNSPETPIYHKSSVLYGLFFGKSEIAKKDECLMVEGYTDVISLHQAGVRNAVASSGTSLTAEQVRLVGRYSKNITLVFDNDPAGVKASFRGIDIVLREGLNARVLLLPEGEDPDSFARANSQEELEAYFEEHTEDFMLFKTRFLFSEIKGDPLKSAEAIKSVVHSISLIPDHLKRSIYTKECANILNLEERVLVLELNKQRRKNFNEGPGRAAPTPPLPEEEFKSPPQIEIQHSDSTFYQERDLLRLIFNHFDKHILVKTEPEEEGADPVQSEIPLPQFIIQELANDGLEMEDPIHAKTFVGVLDSVDSGEFNLNLFLNSEDESIRKLAVSLIQFEYELHDWKRKNIMVKREDQKIRKAVFQAVYAFKERKLEQMIGKLHKEISEAYENQTEMDSLLERKKTLDIVKSRIGKELGRVIIH
jgi:DNA primase